MGFQICGCVLTVDVSPASDVTGEIMRQRLIMTGKIRDRYVAIVIDGLTQFHDCNVVSAADMLSLNHAYKNKSSTVLQSLYPLPRS